MYRSTLKTRSLYLGVMKTNMTLKIKQHNGGYRVQYFEFDKEDQEHRLYWFQDFATLEDIELTLDAV